MRKLKPDHCYIIKIRDHIKGQDRPAIAVVLGVFVKEDEHSYTFAWWYTQDPDEEHNQEYICLLKGGIISMRDLGKF
jgi:hypothetical protein